MIVKSIVEVNERMVKLPKMGKPPYLKPHHVQQDDLLEILEEPFIQEAEESKFGRQRGYVVVRLVRTGEMYVWGLNGTTWDRLIDGLGEDSALWVGGKVKLKLENTTIRGQTRQVMYGVVYREPQKTLAA